MQERAFVYTKSPFLTPKGRVAGEVKLRLTNVSMVLLFYKSTNLAEYFF